MQKQDSDQTPGEPKENAEHTSENADSAMALTVNLVRAYLTNHTVPAGQLGVLLEQTHRTVIGLASLRAEPVEPLSVEMPVRSDCIICLECGKSFRSLKRHLAVNHNMTPAQYRSLWNIPPDYPMVAPDYAASRSRLAISIGLGKKRKRHSS